MLVRIERTQLEYRGEEIMRALQDAYSDDVTTVSSFTGAHNCSFRHALVEMMQNYVPGSVKLAIGAAYCPHVPRHVGKCTRPRSVIYTDFDGNRVKVLLRNYTTALYFMQAYIDFPS